MRPTGLQRADIGVEGEKIVALGEELSGPAHEEIDAAGLQIFPGVIDVHVHFNEPGRADWEGVATGSRALAAGGGTLFCDMPLNSSPPVLDRDSMRAKREAAERSALTDFALWGGLVPGMVDRLPELAEEGVVGFKAFMSDSGLAEFPPVDDLTLYEGMEMARHLGLPVAVHAESNALTAALTDRIRHGGGKSIGDYLRSRPVLAELEAIQRALLFARETGAKLHIVHVSCGQAVAVAVEARLAGVDVTVETCPHYLAFTEEDLQRIGVALKCAPPVRSEREREALRQAVRAGQVDLIASDHSPAPPAMKRTDDFLAAWGGVAGVQSTLPLLLTDGPDWGLGPEQVARLLSAGPSTRFQFTHKGRLARGYDADLALVDPDAPWSLKEGDLLQRHKASPYVGRRFRAAVVRTIVRGKTVYRNGQAADKPWGRFVRPSQ